MVHPSRAGASGGRTAAAAAALWLGLGAAGCAHEPAAPPSPPAQQGVVFTAYTPLSRTEEVARRTLPPLTFLLGQRALQARGEALREQPVDLAQERFSVYVPPGPPPGKGWGLLVFIAPWEEATTPSRWRGALDRHRLVFVAADRSGNEASILDRRLPLALLAWENVRALHPIDPERVYVGGLSGGSRAAEVTALAYPDVFRGALLNAGSDPVDGTRGIYLPPTDLFRRFQETRLVYVTGEHDELNLDDDRASRDSMRACCVFDLEVVRAPRLGHEALDPASLDRALEALDRRAPADPERRAQCNARVQQELARSLAEVEAALARGDRRGARRRLLDVDARFGGVAGAAVTELEARLDAP